MAARRRPARRHELRGLHRRGAAGDLHAAVQCVAFRPNLYELIQEPLNDRRREVGLPPDAEGLMPFRHLFLSPFPPSYLNPDVALPSTTRSVRPTPFDRSGGDMLPDWVDELTGRPLVYLTLGTIFNQRADIFSAFIEGLADEPVELVVTVGRDQDPARFGPQPANVHFERYVPQTLLFPRCALVVSHGGSGTIMAALAHGLPMVVVPIAADQPENAERCAALGVARVVRRADLTPEAAASYATCWQSPPTAVQPRTFATRSTPCPARLRRRPTRGAGGPIRGARVAPRQGRPRRAPVRSVPKWDLNWSSACR